MALGGALRADRAGSPALEFALLAPVMLTVLAGAYDATRLLVAMRQVTATAQQMVQIATEQSIQPDQTTSLTPQQVYQAQTVIFALNPRLRDGNDSSGYSVTLSAAVYTASPAGCTAGVNCSYAAHVAWSKAFPMGTPRTRPCGTIVQVGATTPATIANITTAGMTSVTSLLIADVAYVYRPFFTGFLAGQVTLQRTAFLLPRTGKPTQYVQYDVAKGAANPAVCPGYV